MALTAQRINSPQELADRASPTGDAIALAGDLEASSELVARWGRLARMLTKVESLGMTGANLLDEARVDSLEALASMQADALTCLVRDASKAQSNPLVAPTRTEVALWISQARDALRWVAR